MSAKAAGIKKNKYDGWLIVSFIIIGFYALFLIYPMFSLVKQSFFDASTNTYGLANYLTFFARKANVQALGHSFLVSTVVMFFSLLLGVPLAYFTTCYKIKGSKILRMFIILSSMSPPFVGAYAWIEFFGNNGLLTRLFKGIGINVPSIYGFHGIVLVMSLSFLSLVYLYVCGALKNIDNSLIEASANLGVSGIKRFFKVIIPLIMPTVIAAALLVFMRAFADFGTPSFIGRGYETFTVLIYNEYVGEVSTNKAYAAALSVMAIIITTVIFLLSKALNKKFSFTMNAMHTLEKKQGKPLQSVLMHIYCYLITLLAFCPQIYVIYSSFQNTRGKLFVEGYSLDSYKYVLERFSSAIPNTIKTAGIALVLVIFMAIMIAYLVVRRQNVVNSSLDLLTMLPYIVPGSVVGVALVVAFNKKVLGMPILVGTIAIMVIALVIRRSPYTIRSSVAILQQIPITIEEASISLGASKIKTFFKVTLPMMMNGVISGAILSWVSIITELSTAMYLYNYKTITMTVSVFTLVNRGNYGYASAEAAMLTVFTIISLVIYNIVTKGEGDGFA